jgi:hypothetical protein
VRVGVTRRAIQGDIDADDFGGLEKLMQPASRSVSGPSCTPLGWSPRAEGTSMRAISGRGREANRCRLSVRKSLIMDVQWAPASLARRLERRQ